MGARSASPIITLKDATEVAGMRRAGALVAATHTLLRAHCLPGVTTGELDRLARDFIVERGGIPSFLGYPGPTPFPGAICASVNDEVVHGIPGPRVLRDGDVIAIDVGVILDGWHGDAARTLPVGAVAEPATRLIAGTATALAAGIAAARPGNRVGDIAAAIQRAARREGFGIIREYTGHGIGREMHEEPTVPNYLERGAGSGPVLRPGMTLAIEPMFTLGSPVTVTLADQWTVVTADHSLAAHIEQTIAVAPRGPALVLTAEG